MLGRALARTPQGGPAVDAVGFERAQALFYAGRPGAAAAAFAALGGGDGPLARRARWREADALLAADEPARAARAYARLLAADPGASQASGARVALAEALRQAGDAAGAIATYRALWVELPDEAAARAAARALRRWREAGEPVPGPTPEEWFARARRLVALAQPRRALAALDHLEGAERSEPVSTQARLLRALLLVGLGRVDEGVALARALSADPDPGVRAGAELALARAAVRARRVDEASRRYRALASTRAQVPVLSATQNRELPEDAAFLSAWLYYDTGDFGRAVTALRRYVRERPQGRRGEDARWFEAWALHRLGRDAEARRALARLERTELAPAALYWGARLAPTPAEAERRYRRALEEAEPGTWYALLAAARLGQPALAVRPSAPAAPIELADASTETRARLVRSVDLAAVGHVPAALAELRPLAAAPPQGSAAPTAELAAALGDPELPFRVARDRVGATRRGDRWRHPWAYPTLLPPASRAAGADAFLYLAIMRRESAFKTDARSFAGAVGLVQLIPPTAERLGRVLGAPQREARELEDPEASVPLGAAYLGLLLDRFGHPAAAAAAYNAGPRAAALWARANAGRPLDEWVENVAFKETRRYVKAVLADAAVYRSLWKGGPPALDPAARIPAPGAGVEF